MKETLLKKVKNIVVKGEIVHYEQYLFLSHCYQNASAAEASESVCMWEMFNPAKLSGYTNTTKVDSYKYGVRCSCRL